MDSNLLALLLGIVGTGGLGTVIVRAIASRKLNEAQATMTLAEGYEKRLAVLTSRICELEIRQEALTETVRKFKDLLKDREETIEILQKENESLKAELETMQLAVTSRDERITELESKVEELTLRLNLLTSEK